MTHPKERSEATFEQQVRLERLEARADVQEVLARYCWALDTRDREAFLAEFTPDVRFLRTSDGSASEGSSLLWEYVLDIIGAMGPTLHITTSNLVITTSDGIVSSRHLGLAEHAVEERLVVAALTYDHEYRRGHDGRLRISRRVVTPWYFVDADDLVNHYGSRRDMWWRGAPPRITLPEGNDSWRAFQSGRS